MKAFFETNGFNEKNHSHEKNLSEIKIKSQKFFLNYGQKVIPFEVIKRIDGILLVKSEKYKIQLNVKEFSLLMSKDFYELDNAYEYIIDAFKQKRIKIYEIIKKNAIELRLIRNEGKYIKINLEYNNEENDLIIENLIKYVNLLENNIYQMNITIFNLRNNFSLFKESIINQLQYYFNYFNSFLNNTNSNIKKNKKSKRKNNKKIVKNEAKKEAKKGYKIIYNIAKDSYAEDDVNNTFTVFKSIDDLSKLILAYSTKQKSIISYNLLDNKKIIEIKQAHDDYITNLRHYLDKINKRNLIISVSGHNNNLKLWNFQNWENLCDIKNINSHGDLDSACILNDNKINKYFILTSHNNEKYEMYDAESIKVFDFIGNKIKDIKDSAQRTFYIESFYDNITKTNYIITGNENLIKSYDYSKDKLYHDYKDNSFNDNNNKYCHNYIIVNCYKDIIRLIESSWDNNIRIWNFHS